MQDITVKERIARARQLLTQIHNVSIATVNKDGSPHNSPVFMAFDKQLRAFWASNQDSQHSQDIARDPRIFLVVFDSRQGQGGLYIAAQAKSLEQTDEIRSGYAHLKQLNEQVHGKMGGVELFSGPSPQRIYQAQPLNFWINIAKRNKQGVTIGDRRIKILAEQLFSTSVQ